MISDSFYIIGSTHEECQDYAIHGQKENREYAIVSDGCTSAPFSDWGARLLPQCLVSQLYQGDRLLQEYKTAAALAESHRRALGLHQDALKATMLSVTQAVSSEGDSLMRAAVYGDGFILARKRDKSWQVYQHEFNSNAPYYLAYDLNNGERALYNTTFKGSHLSVKKFSLQPPPIIQEQFEEITAIEKHNPLTIYDFSVVEYDIVAVASDGLGQFVTTKKNASPVNTPVAFNHVLGDITAFKGYAPGFLRRRCQRAFKDFYERGWTNRDDFSIAALYSP